jgi:hypothetical protein
MIRLDIPYVSPERTLTQAGYEVFSGQERRIGAAEADIDALEAVAITAAPGLAPRYACRAWVNFNGTGVVAIRAAGNVSSITDGGIGDYTVNFTTAMPDADYSVVSMAGGFGQAVTSLGGSPSLTVSGVQVRTLASTTGVATDASHVTVAVFR